MRSKNHLPKLTHFALALILSLAWMFSAGLPQAGAAPQADVLPPSQACTAPGTGIVTCELWAAAGTLALPGNITVPIWGYSTSAADPATLPGPMLLANAGDTVQMTLHNNLPVATSLSFPGQALAPDLNGVAPGDTKVYQFTASDPGTFLYEPGPVLKAAPYQLAYQTALGLYGALVVRPENAPGQAYANPETTFNNEALLVLSEIDPVLNNRATPSTFDMRKFKPRYWLINGKAYPQTDPIPALAGENVLLRMVNAGQQSHTMMLLGITQKTLGISGAELPRYRAVISEELPPGASADMLAAIPAAAPAGMRYALYEANLLLHNNGLPGFGGMITFISLPTSLPTGDNLGPEAANLVLAPNPSNGSVDVSLTTTINDATRGDSDITAAEYFIDTQGAPGSGAAMAADQNGFDSPTEVVTAAIPASTLLSLGGINHTVYVHGQDSAGNWGQFSAATLTIDNTGPATNAIALTPPVSNGSIAVAIQATGNDASTGNANIQTAEYFIDPPNTPANGSGTTLAVNVAAPIASLNGSIPATTMSTLSEGMHSLAIHAQDARGNWGALANIGLIVDKTGPAIATVAAVPPAADGSATVRINAALNDAAVSGAQSNIAAAELFIDTLGAPGAGLPMTPADGAYNTTSESAYAFIPQVQVNALPVGAHSVYVRGRDSAGNWGAAVTGTLIIDKDNPTVSGASAAPNPTAGAASITLSATAADPTSPITAAEWYRNSDPGTGMATPMSAADGQFDEMVESIAATINITGWVNGSHTLYVRTRDSAGHWSPAASLSLLVTPASGSLFADSFESGNTSAWSSTTGSNVTVNATAAMQGSFGMQVALTGNTPGFVTDLTPTSETAYHARFYFNPNSTLTGLGLADILAGSNTGGTVIFRLQYRGLSTNGGTYQVRLLITRAGGTTATPFVTISNAAHAIEIDWQSAGAAAATLYLDGVQAASLTGLNTSAYLLDTVRFGPSSGLTSTTTGTPYFDAFISNNSGYIGP